MNNKKTILCLSFTAILGIHINTTEAAIITADFNGLFTMMEANDNYAVQNASNSYYYDATWGYGMRTQISGSLTYDTDTGVGSSSINPFEWFNAGNANITGIDLQGIGDGNGNAGNLIMGNMLFDWNGTAAPLSIVWDASGFLNQGSYYPGQVISSVGATPASDGLVTSSSVSHSLDIGPSPFATTTFNTTATCTVVNTTDCLNVNPSGTLPLSDDGISGSPFIDGAWTGFNANIDITSMTVVSTVPIPAAVWLFGSGLLVLLSLSTKRKI